MGKRAAQNELTPELTLEPMIEGDATNASPSSRMEREERERRQFQRVCLRLSYRGTGYAGWQRQARDSTIQQVVEDALGELLGARIRIIGAGRTDAGVHALAQYAHFDLPRPFPVRGLVLGTNGTLPDDIRVLAAHQVREDFHAQRSALAKTYRYRGSLARVIDPLRGPFVAPIDRRVDLELMRQSIVAFIGRHDFSAFAKSGGSHSHPVRTISSASLERSGDELTFEFRGDGFLRGMVRAMVGTLVEVGLHQRESAELARLLVSGGERGHAGFAAAASGLVLWSVEYPPDLFTGEGYEGASRPPRTLDPCDTLPAP